MFERLPRDLERLRLRLLREDDLDAFHAYRSDPGVARYQGWAPMTVSEARDFMRLQARPAGHDPGTWRQLAIADRRTDRLLGDIGVRLSPDDPQAEFGLSIASGSQGKGYGAECVIGLIELLFSATPVVQVRACTDARNLPCIAALARAGMHQVATRQAEYKGEACTELLFSTFKVQPIAFDARVDALLSTHHLPTSDLGEGSGVRLFGCSDGERLLGVVGLELFEGTALLRSLAVPDAGRGTGLGTALVAQAERIAAQRGAGSMFLLTETAEGFFARLGYRRAERRQAPSAIAGTRQFSSLCPASAAFMAKSLGS